VHLEDPGGEGRALVDSAGEVFLLPTFDEFLVGYSSFGKSRLGRQQRPELLLYTSPIIAQGVVVGSWRREFRGTKVVIEAAPFEKFSTDGVEALFAAAKRYGDFVGMAVACSVSDVGMASR
jgi:hypothetical protein